MVVKKLNLAGSSANYWFQCVSPFPHIRSGSSPCLWTHYWLQLLECIHNSLLTQINFSEQKFSKNPSSQTHKNEDVEKYLQDAFQKVSILSFGLLWLQNASYVFHIFTNPKASLLHMQFGCVIYMPCVSKAGKKTTKKIDIQWGNYFLIHKGPIIWSDTIPWKNQVLTAAIKFWPQQIVLIKQAPLLQIVRAYTIPASYEICRASLRSLGIFLSCLNECMWMGLGLARLAQPAMGSFRVIKYRKTAPELSESSVLHSWEA